MVNNLYDGMNWWNEIDGIENVLTAIGNHEVYDRSQFTYGTITPTEAYQLYMSRYIDNWGVVHPANKTYYYKDYNQSKIRLIVLDGMFRDETGSDDQNDWLADVLSSARTNDLSVVIANHFPPSADKTKLQSNFTAIDGEIAGGLSVTVLQVVQAFIDSGGKFICYICGHTHCDFICYNTNYPDQLAVVVGTSKIENAYSDYYRVRGTKSQDCINVIGFDVTTKTIKIVRIGADYDCYLRHRGTITINYETKEIISSN